MITEDSECLKIFKNVLSLITFERLMWYNDIRKQHKEGFNMCNGPKNWGIDFNNDGDVSFEESYLTYRISEDIINSNNDDLGDSYEYSGDFGGDDF